MLQDCSPRSEDHKHTKKQTENSDGKRRPATRCKKDDRRHHRREESDSSKPHRHLQQVARHLRTALKCGVEQNYAQLKEQRVGLKSREESRTMSDIASSSRIFNKLKSDNRCRANEGAVAKRRLASRQQTPTSPAPNLRQVAPDSSERQNTNKVRKLRRQIVRMQKELDNERRLVR